MREFALLLPEIFLLITVAFLLLGETTYHGEKVRLLWLTAMIGLASTLLQLLLSYRFGAAVVFSRSLTLDGLGLYFKLLVVVATSIAITSAVRSEEIQRVNQAEIMALMVSLALAISILVSSSHLVLLFVAYALVHALSYYLLGYGRRSALSTEAAFKFFVFSVLSLLLLVYGSAVLFAYVKTLNYYDIHRALAVSPLEPSVLAAIFFLFFSSAAVALGAVPLHFWASDAVQGAPTPVGGFVAFALRASGFGLLLRLCVIVFSQEAGPGAWKAVGAFDWTQAVSVIAGMTILLGAFLAWQQTSAKRMLAYFGLVQAGFGLIGLLVLDQVGFSALLFGLAVEMISLLAATVVLSRLVQRYQSDRLKDWAGSIWIATPETLFLIVALLSLLGAPPSAGFLSRFSLIGAALRHQRLALASVAVVGWILSGLAGARFFLALWGDPKKGAQLAISSGTGDQKGFLIALAVPLLGLFFFAEALLQLASRSLAIILW